MRSTSLLALVLVVASACGGGNAVSSDAGPVGSDAAADAAADTGPDAGPRVIFVSAPEASAASAAYRDGDGPWMPADVTAGMFGFQVSSGRYSIAIGCTHSSPPRVDVYELTTADTTQVEYTATCSDVQATLSGALLQAGTAGDRVMFGEDGAQADAPPNGTSYSFQAPPGTHDLVAVRLLGKGLDADRAMVARGVVAPAGAMIDTDFDFAAMGAIDLEQHSFSISPMSTSVTSVESELVTAGGTRARLSVLITPSARAIPAAVLAPGDLHLVTVRHGALEPPGPYEEILRTAHVLVDGTIVLPATTLAQPSLAGEQPGMDQQYAATWPSHPAGAIYALRLVPRSGANTVWTVEVSDAYAGASFSVQTPDLGGVSGWPSSLHLRPGPQVDWSIEARQGAPVEQLVREVPAIEADVSVDGWMDLFTP